MKLPTRASRLTLLLAGMGLFATAILWSAINSWREGLALRARFELVREQNSRFAGHLREAMTEMHSALTDYEMSGREADWQKFEKVAGQFEKWLGAARQTEKSAPETALLEEIGTAFARYRDEMRLLAKTRAPEEPKEEMIGRMKRIAAGGEPLLGLGSKLATARRVAMHEYVGESERAIEHLQVAIFISLLALLFFAAWSGRVVYRDTIAPLRVRLVESRRNAERQEKLAALGVLAAGVAHEIRNPLTAIKARLYTQQRTLPTASSAHEDAIFIGREIDRLAKITTEFLAFARPAEPVKERVAAPELFAGVRELLGPRLRDEEIELATEAPPGMGIEGDADQLRQALINLVQNAADSIGSRGSIFLRAKWAELAGNAEPLKAVMLEVEDSGKGVPPEIEQRLFDPFFTTKPAGTGLGLSIAARIVEKHGGIVRYRAGAEGGAVFEMILPVAA